MKVHPFADLFPMLPEEQLQELAASIKEAGQLHPILVDADGQLLDGRNRLAACKLAGVEPRVETYTGDAIALIVNANVHRRNITKGIRAMALAIQYPEGQGATARGGRPRKGTAPEKPRDSHGVYSENPGVGEQLLTRARVVLREFGADSEMVKAVMNGLSLEDAYRKAQEQIKAREEFESLRQSLEQRMREMAQVDTSLIVDIDGEFQVPAFAKALVSDMARRDEKSAYSAQMRNAFQQQDEHLSRLNRLRIVIDELQALVDKGVNIQYFNMPEAFVSAVFSSLNQSLRQLRSIGEKYQRAAVEETSTGIRRVK